MTGKLCTGTGLCCPRIRYHGVAPGHRYLRVLFAGILALLLLQFGFTFIVVGNYYFISSVLNTYVWDGNDTSVLRLESQRGEARANNQKSSGLLRFLLMERGREEATAPRLQPCPQLPPNLVGHIPVTFEKPAFEEIASDMPDIESGGQWRPSNCRARHKVALIVPYRDRESHLRIFLNHIHPFLQHQQLDYGIYLVEQTQEDPFNRAMLLNIGFMEARADRPDYQCYIFHDVDLLPEDDRNIYSCPDQPRHMSPAVDTMAYRLTYDHLFGGIEAFRKEHFELINGFSNKFFGWGGEDDDLFNRIQYHGLQLTRYNSTIARYRMIRHQKEYPNPHRFKYLHTGRLRFDQDGINSLVYTRQRIQKLPLYTHIVVDLNMQKMLAGDRELTMMEDAMYHMNGGGMNFRHVYGQEIEADVNDESALDRDGLADVSNRERPDPGEVPSEKHTLPIMVPDTSLPDKQVTNRKVRTKHGGQAKIQSPDSDFIPPHNKVKLKKIHRKSVKQTGS